MKQTDLIRKLEEVECKFIRQVGVTTGTATQRRVFLSLYMGGILLHR